MMSQMMVGRSKSITARVVEEIANEEDAGELEIEPLFESVDPDALETIFADPQSAEHVTVEFVHSGYHVTIAGGRISVDHHDDS